MKEKSYVNFVIMPCLRRRSTSALAAAILLIFGFVLYFSNQRNVSSTALDDSIKLPLSTKAPVLGKELDPETATIFLAVPSLSDQACNITISNAFKQARNPKRIFFGIYQQSKTNDLLTECLNFDCVQEKPPRVCDHLDNISIKRVDVSQAMGPVWARYQADKLYQKHHDFIILMDSHLLFRENWDSYAIKMWQEIGNEYAILTHYPDRADFITYRSKCFDDPNCDNKFSYHICGSEFTSSGIPRNANPCWIQDVPAPVLTPFFACGFAFARSHLREAVPWDPHQRFLFWGEEMSYGTRAWTHGYDFYSPHKDIVGHWYDRGPPRDLMGKHEPKGAWKLRKSAQYRVLYLWGVLPSHKTREATLDEIDKYGMGDKRTLDQYWEWSGIDLKKKTSTKFDNELYFKGGLMYVPWNLDPL